MFSNWNLFIQPCDRCRSKYRWLEIAKLKVDKFNYYIQGTFFFFKSQTSGCARVALRVFFVWFVFLIYNSHIKC